MASIKIPNSYRAWPTSTSFHLIFSNRPNHDMQQQIELVILNFIFDAEVVFIEYMRNFILLFYKHKLKDAYISMWICNIETLVWFRLNLKIIWNFLNLF